MRKKGRRYRVKVTKIVCDHCHKEITGNPIKFFPERVDRKTGDIMTTGTVPGAKEQHNKDYCEACTTKALAFLNGMAINPDFEAAVGQDVPEKEKTQNVEQKPSVKDLILQGYSKNEILRITECKPTSYDTIKYNLKKKGLLKDEPENEPKTYDCSKVGKKCIYSTKIAGNTEICDYIRVEGHSRGCEPDKCTKLRRR